jgi:hypothetical protein
VLLVALTPPLASCAQSDSESAYLWFVRDSTASSRFADFDASRLDVASDRVRVMYVWFGAYPRFQGSSSGEMRRVHGGIPQRVVEDDSLWAQHVASIKRHVNHPWATIGIDEGWTGYAVIDYESWSPLWRKTKPIYRRASITHERELDSKAPADTLRARARRRYERSARIFLERTIAIADSLRPAAKWGYYGWPHPGRIDEPSEIEPRQQANDELAWLYEAAEVIYPSIYLNRRSVAYGEPGSYERTVEDNCFYVESTLREAFRVAKGRPVVPFTWYYYHTNTPGFGGELLEGLDTQLQFVYPFSFPIDGAIVWARDTVVDGALADWLYGLLDPLVGYVHDMRARPDLDERWFVPAPCMTADEPSRYEDWGAPSGRNAPSDARRTQRGE